MRLSIILVVFGLVALAFTQPIDDYVSRRNSPQNGHSIQKSQPSQKGHASQKAIHKSHPPHKAAQKIHTPQKAAPKGKPQNKTTVATEHGATRPGVSIYYDTRGRMRVFGFIRLTGTLHDPFSREGSNVGAELARNAYEHCRRYLLSTLPMFSLANHYANEGLATWSGIYGTTSSDHPSLYEGTLGLAVEVNTNLQTSVWQEFVTAMHEYWERCLYPVDLVLVHDATIYGPRPPLTPHRSKNKRVQDQVCVTPLDLKPHFTKTAPKLSGTKMFGTTCSKYSIGSRGVLNHIFSREEEDI